MHYRLWSGWSPGPARRTICAAIWQAWSPSRKEDGNLRYDLFEDQETPGQFVFVEEWASTEARTRHHEHGPHIQHFHRNGVDNIERTVFAHVLKRIV